MTPTDLAKRVLELDLNSTKGPWETEVANPVTFVNSVGGKISYCTVDREHNAHLIAEYRTAAPELAREYLKLRGALEKFDKYCRYNRNPNTYELISQSIDLRQALEGGENE